MKFCVTDLLHYYLFFGSSQFNHSLKLAADWDEDFVSFLIFFVVSFFTGHNQKLAFVDSTGLSFLHLPVFKYFFFGFI